MQVSRVIGGQMNDSAGLSKREREVLDHLQLGLTNRQIAQRLGISANTVNKHVQQVLRKLGAGNRMLAVIRARRPPTPLADDRYLQAIDKYQGLNLVDRLREARIEYAEALDDQGRTAEAKEEWRLAALVDRNTHDPMQESLDGTAG